ncbi:MAG: hypothetical protein KCHDKBKB_02698 [Elusimicrobia bacterium]|nr:hypothetical protein [Elusimicrobiota bacterium]
MPASELTPKEYLSVLGILKKIDFFQNVPEEELKNVLFSLQKDKVEANKTILFQGEISNRLFIIREGSVVISTKNKGQKLVLAQLDAGTYFGEISLLRPISATATVTAGEAGVDLIILPHESMNSISKKIPDIHERIEKVIESRLASKKKAKEVDENAEETAPNS